MAYLETIGKSDEGLPYTFSIFQLDGNSDLVIEINNFKGRSSNALLRLFVQNSQYSELINNMLLFGKIIDNKETLNRFENFLKIACFECEDGKLIIEYEESENKITFTIIQFIKDYINDIERKASIDFVCTGSSIVDGLVVKVKNDVFNCIALLQNIISKMN